MKKKIHVNTSNAKSEDEIRALNQIASDKICPFCGKDYLEKEHKKPILEETKHWLATENRWPYKGSSAHLLLIHKKHVEHLLDISPEAWIELRELAIRMVEKLQIPGATLIMRFGDFRYTGGTVTHLHAQIVSGDPEKGEPVIARVG